VPIPLPKAGQVLVKISAAGMNPMDRVLASGDWRPMHATFPMVLGADFAGVVEELSEGSKRFAVRDNVFGQSFVPHSDRLGPMPNMWLSMTMPRWP
jgi:NADPH:quinone reductase